MAIEKTAVTYDVLGGPCESIWVHDSGAGEQPGLLLFPNFLGVKEADQRLAEWLAALGFKVLLVDYYGVGKRGTDMESGAALMLELVADRALMRSKLQAHLGQLYEMGGVLPGRVGAVGFCLGGKCVLDLARAGAEIVGVVIHGVYDRPELPGQAMNARLLVCHGWNDPLCPPEALVGLGAELTQADIDWKLIAFANAGHAFTDESIPLDASKSFGYVPSADAEAREATARFLSQSF